MMFGRLSAGDDLNSRLCYDVGRPLQPRIFQRIPSDITDGIYCSSCSEFIVKCVAGIR